MILTTKIVTTTPPRTKKEARSYFNDERIKGKRLVSFECRLDNFKTQTDPYTGHFNLGASYYDLTAEFE